MYTLSHGIQLLVLWKLSQCKDITGDIMFKYFSVHKITGEGHCCSINFQLAYKHK